MLGGGNIRQAHLLGSLAAEVPTDLLVAGSRTDDATRAAVRRIIEVPHEPLPAPRSATGRRLRSLQEAFLPSGPSERLALRRPRTALAAALSRLPDDYDVVCVEHIGLADLSRHLPASRRALTVHNVLSVTLTQQAEIAAGPRQAWLCRQEARRARLHEARALRSFDVTFSVSEEDAAALPADTVVVPNGVDVNRFPVGGPLPATPRLIFVGTFSYGPNVDGAVWFCDEVLPLVQAVVPGAELELVGRDPVEEVRSLCRRPGVSGSWNPPDVASHLRSARLAVIPLRAGSGTRLKALEAMAARLPVVGTSVGLSGLGLRDGEHAFVRDDASTFAEGCIQLLKDDALSHRLAATGHEFVETRFDWSHIAATFLAHLEIASPTG